MGTGSKMMNLVAPGNVGLQEQTNEQDKIENEWEEEVSIHGNII
jgi:hypothetical protein